MLFFISIAIFMIGVLGVAFLDEKEIYIPQQCLRLEQELV